MVFGGLLSETGYPTKEGLSLFSGLFTVIPCAFEDFKTFVTLLFMGIWVSN